MGNPVLHGVTLHCCNTITAVLFALELLFNSFSNELDSSVYKQNVRLYRLFPVLHLGRLIMRSPDYLS